MNKMIVTNKLLLKDFFSLIRPKITLAVLIVLLGGMSFSDFNVSFLSVVFSLIGITLLVSASSIFNMYIEREHDAIMIRTKNRPLPAKRLEPNFVLILAWFLFLLSLPILYIGSNKLTVLLGVLALFSYVLLYTPLKRISFLALFIGAIPGAMPPLIGYAIVSGEINKISICLFFLLFIWQLPHFLSISIFRGKEYIKAGYPMITEKLSIIGMKNLILITIILLFISSMSLWFFNAAGLTYKINSIILGLWFIFWGLKGFFYKNENIWAKKIFFVSIKYQIFLFLSLIVDFYVK